MKSRLDRQLAKAEERNARTNRGERAVATNRRAFHEYEIVEKIEAGIALTGTEVKSLRESQVNLGDGYVVVEDGEAWLHNVHVSPYEAGSYNNPDPARKRKLLLHRREILRLGAKIKKTGSTCIPLSVYFKGPYAKVQIAVAIGKKQYDKRETIRRRESEREARGAMKAARR
jgi:SsrA-binding protein